MRNVSITKRFFFSITKSFNPPIKPKLDCVAFSKNLCHSDLLMTTVSFTQYLDKP